MFKEWLTLMCAVWHVARCATTIGTVGVMTIVVRHAFRIAQHTAFKELP